MYTRTLLTLPPYADTGFFNVYSEGADDEVCEAFASTWGGLDRAAFQQAFTHGQGEDRVVAIFALGTDATPQIAEQLLSLLTHSSLHMERFACALCLGRMNEQRALPLIETLLLDGLDLAEYSKADEQNGDLLYALKWCGTRRSELIYFLREWHSPTLIQTLRQTLQALWNIQQTLHPFPFEVNSYDAVAYVLGARDAFAALNDIDFSIAQRNTALVYMALGHLYAHNRPERGVNLLKEMRSDAGIRQEVARVLSQYAGLSPQEQQDCVNNFEEYAQARVDRPDIEYEDDEVEDIIDDNEDEDGDEIEVNEIELPRICNGQGHSAKIHCIAWSPDATRLVSGSEDTTARVWQANTGKMLLNFQLHQESVNAVAWSPRGDLIASGGNDNTIYIWNANTGALSATCAGHTSWLVNLAWSPDGTRIASASFDKTVRIWDAFSGRELMILSGHAGIVYSVAWSPDGAHILSGGGYPEGLIMLWNSATGGRELVYGGHGPDIRKERSVSADADAWLEEWIRAASSVHYLAWSPDSKRIASAGLRNVCHIWNAASGADLVATNRTSGPIGWSPSGVTLLVLQDDPRIVEVWDARTDVVTMKYHMNSPEWLTTFAVSSNGKYLAADAGKLLQVWRIPK
jgi:hypothetical protein